MKSLSDVASVRVSQSEAEKAVERIIEVSIFVALFWELRASRFISCIFNVFVISLV